MQLNYVTTHHHQKMAEHIECLNPAKELPIITHGLPYEDAIAQHLTTTLKRTRPYCSSPGR